MNVNSFEYDVAVRTVGFGGEKYKKLLASIKNLVPKPKNIYIILPELAKEPPEKIGHEIFIYTQKGMITQRLAALEHCTAPYILFCDDDISFASDFVQKLHRALTLGYSFATGENLSMLPALKGIKHYVSILTAGAIPAISKNNFVTILRSSGWSYNRFTPEKNFVLPTQSAAGIAFYTSVEVLRTLKFHDELWAQHGTLAPADDQIMFYKAHKLGLRVCVVTDAHVEHLNAKSSVTSEQTKKNKIYYSGFNRAVFWHRFIFSVEKNFIGKIISFIAFGYYIFANSVYLTCRKILKPKAGTRPLLFLKGMLDGLLFTRTEQYQAIPNDVKKQR